MNVCIARNLVVVAGLLVMAGVARAQFDQELDTGALGCIMLGDDDFATSPVDSTAAVGEPADQPMRAGMGIAVNAHLSLAQTEPPPIEPATVLLLILSSLLIVSRGRHRPHSVA